MKRHIACAIFAAAVASSLHASLPTSGNGWTLASQSDGSYTLHSDIESAIPYSGTTGAYQWMLQAGGSFVNSNAGTNTTTLLPQSGDAFYLSSIGSTTSNQGLAIYFQNVPIQVGTYSVSFNIAAIDGKTFAIPGYLNLLADTNANGLLNSNERLSASSTSRPSTADGGWVTWTYNFTITDTSVLNSTTVAGTTLGFVILGSTANTGFAFDNFNVTFTPATPIPEPGTVGLLCGIATFAFSMCRRPKKNASCATV